MPELYLYAIAPADAVDVDGKTGLRDASVRTIDHEGVSAVVSEKPDGKLRPRRRNLKAHHGLLKTLTTEGTILPMAFGVLATSEAEIEQFLEDHRDTLLDQLGHVDGHVEIGLRVKLTVDDVFAYFVDRYDELRDMRNAFFGGEGDASRQQMLRLGERFEEFLEAERAAHRSTVEEALAPVCRAVTSDTPKDEAEMMNLSCLVPRDGVEAFEDAVQTAAEDFSDDFLFRYTDPMAPYSFADVTYE